MQCLRQKVGSQLAVQRRACNAGVLCEEGFGFFAGLPVQQQLPFVARPLLVADCPVL